MGLMRRLDAALRAAFPAVFALALMVLGATPVGVPGLVTALALPSVFFWSVFRPAAMPPPVVFAIGLLHDLLVFAPLGIGVLVLLLVHGLAFRARQMLARASFLAGWLAFCAVAAGAAGLGWALQALLGWQWPALMPGVHLFGAAVGLYPGIAWILTRAHMAMRRAEGAAP
ncbi:MAG: rod shape-determining protein MreD [Roseococcus sp.]|nr:rod shape-determining protein MreD [Roseococcus sp.]